MCRMRGPALPAAYGESPAQPLPEGANALYPALEGADPRPSRWFSDLKPSDVSVLPIVGSVIGRTLNEVQNITVPKEFMAPQLPLILPLPGRGLVPIRTPSAVPKPTFPPTPMTGSPFAPLNPKSGSSSPPPSSAPTQQPPVPPTSDKPVELPESKGFVPPDLKDVFKPLAGGDFTIPQGGLITLPGSTIPDDIPGVLVLAIKMLKGEQQGGVIGQVGHVEEEDLIAADPMYGKLKKLAERAAEIVGPGKGPERGKQIHSVLGKLIKEELTEAEKRRIRVEYTAGQSGDGKYGTKGQPRVDVFYKMDDGEMRIYELKTGTAREKAARVYRLFKDTFFGKITKATIAEIWVQ